MSNKPIAVPLLLLLIVAAVQAGCVHTEPFRDASGRVLENSIAEMSYAEIGGIRQMLWFRGRNVDDPALILLHGGPGASEMALFRHYNAGLEQHFLVVYWEQRGAGRSFDPDIPPETMTVDRMVADLDEVVRLVQARFGKRRVVLLGHSWGTVLGTIYARRHPENVAAYVGTGQVVDGAEERRLSYRFALERARQRGHDRAVAELEEIGPPPHDVEQELRVGRWVERLGGEFHGDLSKGRLILAALRTDEANLRDLVAFGRGNAFSLEHLHDQIAAIDFRADATRFEVPVVFLLGRYDWNTPSVLAADYFRAIEAPAKTLVWFDGSAHNPPFEEPERFNRVIIEQVRPFAEPR